MKTLARFTTAALASVVLFGAGPSLSQGGGFQLTAAAEARTRVSVSFGVFYDQLRPYGRWVRHGSYGQVWVPAHQRNWRPYTMGRWAMTNDYGWMWVSDEPFGWATYHYGSWDYDRRLGWYWVPGYVWGPAWVTWSDRGDYIGWAPIPASYLWGQAFNDFFYYRPVIRIVYQDSWCYAPTRHFGDRRIDRHVVPARQNVTVINNTTVVNNVTSITNVTIVDNRVYNGGVPVVAVNAVAETPVETVQVTDATAPAATGDAATPGVVEVYRPVETPISDDPAVIQEIATQQTEAAADPNPTAPPDIQDTIERPGPAAAEIPVEASVPESGPAPELDASIAPTDPLPQGEPDFGETAVPLKPEAPAADQTAIDQPVEQTYTDPGQALPQPEAQPAFEQPAEAPIEQSYADPAPAFETPSYDAPAADPVYENPQPEALPAPEPSYEAPVEAPVEQSYADPAASYEAPAPEPSYEAPPAETYTAPDPQPEPSYDPTVQESYAAPEPAPEPAYEAPAPTPEPAYEPPPAPAYEPPPAPEPPPPAPPPPSSETTDQQ